MKHMGWLFALATLLLIGCNSSGDKDTATEEQTAVEQAGTATSSDASSYNGKRYTVASAIIKYKVSGNAEGTEELYFDNWGMREVKYTKTTTSMGGMTQETNTMELLDGSAAYSIDFTKNTGTKMPSPFSQEMQATKGDEYFIEMGKKMLKDMGGKMIGTESFLGRECEVWEVKDFGLKTWVWNGVTLKTEMNKGFKMLSEAVSIEEGTAIPADKFRLPSNIQITDYTEADGEE